MEHIRYWLFIPTVYLYFGTEHNIYHWIQFQISTKLWTIKLEWAGYIRKNNNQIIIKNKIKQETTVLLVIHIGYKISYSFCQHLRVFKSKTTAISSLEWNKLNNINEKFIIITQEIFTVLINTEYICTKLTQKCINMQYMTWLI